MLNSHSVLLSGLFSCILGDWKMNLEHIYAHLIDQCKKNAKFRNAVGQPQMGFVREKKHNQCTPMNNFHINWTESSVISCEVVVTNLVPIFLILFRLLMLIVWMMKANSILVSNLLFKGKQIKYPNRGRKLKLNQ